MQFKWILSAAMFAILFCAFSASAASADTLKTAALEIGDPAPIFNGPDETGKLWQSSDIVGKEYLVVYFYPAAMSSGCTRQACAYRDDMDQLTRLDVVVVGISGDEPAGIKVFKEVHQLNFPLLSDPEGRIARQFGVPTGSGGQFKTTVDDQEVTLSRGVTAQRWTFVIGLDGRIIYKDTDVDAANDSGTVIRFIESLSDSQHND